MILGITGGSGCGKTTLLDEIRRIGGTVYDCDAIYHALLQSDEAMLGAIRLSFPNAFSGDTLDRKALGRIVFSDAQKLAKLNEITHKCVKAEVLRRLESKPKLAAIDAISLFEADLASICDATVAVNAATQSRIARLCARDGIDRDYALSRIAAQHDNDWFSRHCDYVLENNNSIDVFRSKCIDFLKKVCIIDT